MLDGVVVILLRARTSNIIKSRARGKILITIAPAEAHIKLVSWIQHLTSPLQGRALNPEFDGKLAAAGKRCAADANFPQNQTSAYRTVHALERLL